MKQLKSLYDVLNHEVQMLHNVEKLQIAALERMIKKTSNPRLQDAFEQHLEETKVHKKRLEVIAGILNIDAAGEGNPSIKGMIAENEKMIHKNATPEARDAALIAGAQKIEHYEIAGYGTAAYLAQQLGLLRIGELLDITLQEEQATDTILNMIAKSEVNEKADVAYA
jgi:ferritin-like metal-binding protein YciE